MKRTLSTLLIIVLLMGILPPVNVFATTTISDSEWKGFNGYIKDDKQYYLTEKQKNALIQLKLMNVPLNNKHVLKSGQKVMYVAIKPLLDPKQPMVVYNYGDTFAHIDSAGFGGLYPDNQSYKYLGYTLEGKPVTNDLYYNYASGQRTPTDILNYQYKKIDNATNNNEKSGQSWKNISPSVTEHILKTKVESEDSTEDKLPKDFTLMKILGKSLNYSTNLNDYKPYTLVQSAPTFKTDGNIKTYYRGWSNKTNTNINSYNTFTVSSMGKEFKPPITTKIYSDSACTQQISEISLLPTEPQKTVYAKVSVNLDMTSIGFQNKESEIVQSVQNSLTGGAKSNLITSIPNKYDVNSVYPITLKWKDYTPTFKSNEYTGNSVVMYKSDMLDQNNLTATATLNVRSLKPTDVAPEFDIIYENEIRTDQAVVYDKPTLDKDFSFNLKDLSFVPSDNEIKTYNWFALNHSTGKYDDYFGWTKDTSYTLTVEKQKDYLKDNKVSFKLLITDKQGKQHEKTHEITLLTKGEDEPDPTQPPKVSVPKAYVFAPPSVRAGQKSSIRGEGTSELGISSYDFEFAYDFRSTREDENYIEGTFLRFDPSQDDDWIDTTYLKVTDSAGTQSSEASGQTKVKHPIIPVFKTHGVYKVHRTITLDGSESTGTHYYPIDKISWVIRPMDGQLINVVKPHVASKINGNSMTIEGVSPKVDFKQLGRYEVWMDVHSTCTFTGETHRTASKQVYGIINIQPDEPPVAKLTVPSKTIRSLEDGQQATITVWDESYSPDGDSIGKRKFYVRRDINNDKKTDDETWEMIYEGTADRFDYKAVSVGFYEFRVEVEEANDSITSPFWNAATDTLRANSDTQALAERQAEVINVAPIVSYLAERKKLDLVLVTDYEGSDFTALKTELDLLTKDLFERGVDIEVQVFKDKLPNGRVKVPVYTYTRTMHLSYVVDAQINSITMNNQTFYKDQVWETRYQTESEFLPNYGSQPVSYTKGWYDSGNSDYGIIDYGIQLNLSAPYDPAKKNGIFRITETKVVNGSVEYHNNHRDINVWLDGHYTRGSIYDYKETDLYCMDLAKLQQNVKYREGSDRHMVFVMKNGDSLTTLNQSFADYIQKNVVTVNAINGFDMTSQYGGIAIQDAEWFEKPASERGPGTIVEYDINKNKRYVANYNNAILKGINLHMESGKDFALLNPYGTSDYSLQYEPKADYPVVNSNYTRKAADKNNDRYKVTARPVGGDIYSNEAERTTYTRNLENWLMDASTNDTTGIDLGERTTVRRRNEETGKMEYYTEVVPSPRTLIGHMSGFFIGTDKYFIKNNNLYKASQAQSELPWQNATLVDTNVREVKRPTDGGATYLIIYHMNTNKTQVMAISYTNSGGFKTVNFEVNGKIIEFTTQYFLTDSGALCTAKMKFTGGAGKYADGQNYTFFEPIAEQIKASIGGGYFLSYSGDLLKIEPDVYYNRVYWITQGLNVKKLLFIKDDAVTGRSKHNMVLLTHDGKLYGVNKYYYERIFDWNDGLVADASHLPLTQDKLTSLVKDPRTLSTPVVNAMSMRKLLNQSSANRISGSFTAFGDRLRAEYEYLKYQTRTILLLGEELKYSTIYYDYEGDPMLSSAVSIAHDPNALESPIGTDVNNGKTISDWDRKLNKTGLYTLNPKVQDNPSGDTRFADYRLWNKDNMTLEVLVHRKPIASMKLSMTPVAPFIVTARDSNSRDLDHITMSAPLRGITEVEWGIKKLYDDEWEISKGALNTALTKSLETGETYIVSYRVKDVEGAWSDPVTEQIVAGMNLLLDAKLKPENPTHNFTNFQTGNNLVFHELWTSYPLAHHLEIQMYDGNTPILSKVTLRKEWGQVKSEAYPERDWKDAVFNIPRTINGVPLADKAYNFVVTAFDSSNPSIKKQKQFQVTTISNRAPIVKFTMFEPKVLYEGDFVDVKLKVDDPDQDLLNLQVYIRYDNSPEKLLETHRDLMSGTTIGLKRFELPKAAKIQLRAVVTDPLGALGEATVEKPIGVLGIEEVSLKGAWNHWRGQTNAFGQQMTNEPYRFLGYEKVSMTVTTRGEPEQLSLRLEAPLEAMHYVDAKGRTYTYKEEIGAEVQFPIIFRKQNANNYYMEYILPAASSTLTWEGQRKRSPYQLYLTLQKEGRVRTIILGDAPGEVCIDMTGNIFDLVFNQPARPKR